MPAIIVPIALFFIIIALKLRLDGQIHGWQYLYLFVIISCVMLTLSVIFSVLAG